MTLRQAAIVITGIAALSMVAPTWGRKVVSTTRPVKASRSATGAAKGVAEPAVTIDTIAAGDTTMRLAGYDKPLRSRHETIFATSLVDDTVCGLTFTVTYMDMQGRTLHERDVTVSTLIPPRATRKVDFPSWDRQQTFYYHLGPKPRTSSAVAYDVTMRMRALLKPRSTVSEAATETSDK